jgi:hypothetical protein
MGSLINPDPLTSIINEKVSQTPKCCYSCFYKFIVLADNQTRFTKAIIASEIFVGVSILDSAGDQCQILKTAY